VTGATNAGPPWDKSKRWTSRLMFKDPSGGAINLRILTGIMLPVAQYATGKEKEKLEFMDLLVVLSLKLAAVWTHLHRFKEEEDRLIAAGRARPFDVHGKEDIRIETAQQLYLEFDGFLVQLKSTLDYMTKTLSFGLGLPFSSLTTFGDKGNVVRNILTKNLPKQLKGVGKAMSELIETNQEWLNLAIDLRDRTNHYKDGGILLKAFVVAVGTDNGKEVITTPSFGDGMTLRTGITHLYDNLLEFVDHFVGLAILPRIAPRAMKRLPPDPKNANAPRWECVVVTPEVEAVGNSVPG
jgi:hypothetical protein